jgi:ABC-type uncharacterized transport system ATPase subunit
LKPSVEMRGVTKRFGRIVALDDVSFSAFPGEIHALVGENGAGKSTLIKVLQGTYSRDAGEVTLDGKSVHPKNAQEGFALGIGMVSQHYAIIPELSCLENLMLGAEGSARLHRPEAKLRADEIASKMEMSFDWDAAAETLSPAGAQKLEILKLLWRESSVMILDEPTAMLSPDDSDALFASLQTLAARGATIIVVTHRLPEVMTYAARITVLRGGKLVEAKRVADTHVAELAELIIGKTLDEPAVREPSTSTDVVVRVSDLTVQGHRGDDAVKEVSFDLRAGECVGLAGVDGNGQKELFHALLGQARIVGGTIELLGHVVTHESTRALIERGVRLIAEDRHSEAIIEDWSLTENVLLGLQRRPELRSGATINRQALSDFATGVLDRFDTKRDSALSRMRSLSGGNQQRVVAARALGFGPRLILAFQPTRGLDIAGTRQVYDAIKQACDNGAAALVASFDLDELIDNCDRVMAINRGRLHVPATDQQRDRTVLGGLMVTT